MRNRVESGYDGLDESEVTQPFLGLERLRDEGAEVRVALVEPSARRNPICDVGHLILAEDVDEVAGGRANESRRNVKQEGKLLTGTGTT